MKVLGVGTVLMVLTFSAALWGRGVPKPSLDFPVTNTTKLRCSIEQSGAGQWDLKVIASDSNNHPTFEYFYSVRKHISASVQDCHAWMMAVKKAGHSAGAPRERTKGTG